MKTLVIIAHPNLEGSRVNQRWTQELLRYPNDIAVHELYKAYPDWNIDVPREQHLLEAYDHVILQFPFYWYSYPPLLKKWFDEVWTYGWAYGSQGDKLKGTKLGLAMSIGDKKNNYVPEGSVSFTVDQLITPFVASARHAGAVALPYFAVFGASFRASDEEIDQSARDYIEHIFKHCGV
ncbi:NAD(P)H-dependent oxidoreductase [Paenibacillus sp. NFR01]|uniref:NAD(P)H-dependent oxidoreductase n=1 Tax=Paenibacillus sp. NFR01 TaxID=1566279 RepID=UPI0008C36449|nr:NAD(P)H-dependent oxidoreductase [Paenibacillus sp. NFR01]SEU27706.1 Putative NADPH-quinone reductase (modulator of drug activity B) [Paenibacillus sp. NFR01]